MNFPLFCTKTPGVARQFDLIDPAQRQEYFQAKAGPEIKKIREFLAAKNTFIAYLLAKKQAGKGTYSKLFIDAIGEKYTEHLSVGDIVRMVDEELQNKKAKKELVSYLESNYRGFLSVEEVIAAHGKRSVKTLLPTEFILALVRREIERRGRKALFLDGFPRGLDQVSYSLFFRNLVGARDDLDFFVLIDVPREVIHERLKNRVICPKCQTSRSLKFGITKKVGFDEKKKEFYLLCDNPLCQEIRMVPKESDSLGIEAIRERLESDHELLQKALSLYGIPKILLRNSVPISEAKKWVDDYEITPESVFSFDKKTKEVKVEKRPWVIKDDNGVPSYSLLPAPVVISLLKQIAELT
ncbi:hypothetical protein FJZ40_00510 [Candidatus Shapirobacteria bacterium]|nr:hypothetical protein [Candidatus Shapirobacteria bacterium]